MRRLTLAVLLCALRATSVWADPPPVLSLQRGAVGIDAQAKWVKDDPNLHTIGAVWGSYSLTENLSAFASQGYLFDRKDWDWARVGVRMYVPNDPVRVALGANYLRDWESKEHSWNVGLYAGWIVGKGLAGTAAIEKDVPRDETSYRIGLRYKVAGGK